MASRVLSRIAKSGVTQRLILESRRHEPILNLCGSFHSASEPALVSSAKWLFSPASCFQKHTPLVNATFQRYGFSSTASPEPNDKESNQSAGHENESAKANGDSTVSEKTQDTDAEPDLSIDDLVKLVQEKEELLKLKHKEIEKMQDKVLRSYAEMENVLDRTRREAENSKKFAIQNFAKNLLDVADNLGRASSVVKDSFSKIDVSKDSTGAVPLLKTLLEGVEMTEKQLTEANVRDDSNTITSFITFVLGGPGSGKGTQCAKIAETFGFIHLSAGDLLRNEMSSDSENGAMIRDTIKEGRIVPSEVTVSLIRKAIESNKNSKILIDGFPRSDENRIAFERIVGVEPDLVVFFDCPEEEMVKRVLSRNQGRIDDNIDTVKKRLEVFNKLNLPVVNYYSGKGKVWKISAVGTVEQVFENVRPIFAALR